jgi:hypothetical protein
MPTVFGYHDVKDTEHWLASPKREEFFGPLGVTNIRTFVDPEQPTRVGVLSRFGYMPDDERWGAFVTARKLALGDSLAHRHEQTDLRDCLHALTLAS